MSNQNETDGQSGAEQAPVLSEDRGRVRLLTLNRPHRKNAFNEAQWDAFADALHAARIDTEVAVLLVTGAGTDFSSGVDLSSFAAGAPQRSDGFQSGYHRVMDALTRFDKPLAAAARGVCIGFGATFLFHCDLVFLGESARLRLPFVSLGLVPEGASSYLLQTLVGRRAAAELLLDSGWIEAKRAHALGLATQCCPDAELQGVALARAQEIARMPVSALQATKRTLLAVHAEAIAAAQRAEDAGMAAQVGSPANIEALRAFAEKRQPDFSKL